MNELSLFTAMNQTLLLTLKAVCLITIPVLITGVIISIFQAATQINEMTVTFIPKLLVMFLVLLTFLPWLFQTLVQVTEQLIYNIPSYIR